MNVKKTRVGLLIAILTVALMFSLFTVSAFAETEAVTQGATTEATPDATPDASTAAPEASKAPETTKTPETTKSPATSGDGHNHGNENDNTDTIISLIVGGVIIVVIGIVCIIKRESLGKFLRGLKSEMKKVVWLPKNQTLRSTVVVLIIVAVCAIVIGVLDFAFGSGIKLLGNLF